MVNLKRNIRETEGLNCESQLLHKSLTLAKEQIEKKNLLSIWNTLCKNLTPKSKLRFVREMTK